jgi:hypothetical protein
MGMNTMAAVAGAMKGATTPVTGGRPGTVADQLKKRKKQLQGAATAGAGDLSTTGLLSGGVAGTHLVGPAMRAAGRGFFGY